MDFGVWGVQNTVSISLRYYKIIYNYATNSLVAQNRTKNYPRCLKSYRPQIWKDFDVEDVWTTILIFQHNRIIFKCFKVKVRCFTFYILHFMPNAFLFKLYVLLFGFYLYAFLYTFWLMLFSLCFTLYTLHFMLYILYLTLDPFHSHTSNRIKIFLSYISLNHIT